MRLLKVLLNIKCEIIFKFAYRQAGGRPPYELYGKYVENWRANEKPIGYSQYLPFRSVAFSVAARRFY